jgi:hypothetical protein
MNIWSVGRTGEGPIVSGLTNFLRWTNWPIFQDSLHLFQHTFHTCEAVTLCPSKSTTYSSHQFPFGAAFVCQSENFWTNLGTCATFRDVTIAGVWVASGATTPGPAFEGAPRFRPKVVLMSLSSIPIEILWPRAVMVGHRPRVLLTLPLDVSILSLKTGTLNK